MTKKIKSVPCSDWQLGWGYGGHNKLGKLYPTDEANVFVWKGHAQGRHGQRLAARNEVTFRYEPNDPNKLILLSEKNNKGSGLPVTREVIKAIETLTLK